MQIGVYGSGYLGTVISACLADFGTPVSCCHPDRSRMVEMAQGNIPFFEKNLKEIIRRNVRAGRLALGRARIVSAVTTEQESFSFAVLHFGDQNITAAVKAYREADAAEFEAFAKEAAAIVQRAYFPEVI